jgi:hypothetical protein
MNKIDKAQTWNTNVFLKSEYSEICALFMAYVQLEKLGLAKQLCKIRIWD